MSLVTLHLWREWREHRTTLVAVSAALPVLAWLGSHGVPKRMLGDEIVALVIAASFALIVLVAIGGELLGAERRGSGLRWLERMPHGLRSAFAAKLVVLVGTTVVAWFYGIGVSRCVSFLRGAPASDAWGQLLVIPLLVVAVWTFACSAWALRGGLAFMAAALVLGLIGYPIGSILWLGYHPSLGEAGVAMLLLFGAGLTSAGLAFIVGGRVGGGTGMAAILGLAPAIPLSILALCFASVRRAERARFDPLADDFCVQRARVTDDGQRAFLIGMNLDHRWDSLPGSFISIDLESGEWKKELSGDSLSWDIALDRPDGGFARPARLVVWDTSGEGEVAFDLMDGSATREKSTPRIACEPKGLGQWILMKGRQVIHDPFRHRDFACEDIPFWSGRAVVLVRQDQWLCSTDGESEWFLYDPDMQQRGRILEDVWPLGALPDGRVLLVRADDSVVCLDPSTWSEVPVELGGLRLDASDTPGLFKTFADDRYTLCRIDPETLRPQVMPAPVSSSDQLSLSGDRAYCVHWDTLIEVDLSSGEVRVLFPRR